MAELVSLGALAARAVTALAPMTIKAVAREWARRKADHAHLDPATLAPEMDEALDVLARAQDDLLKAVVTAAKAAASGLPEIFGTPAVRDWLRQDAARTAVKAAVTALLTRAEAPEALNAALIGSDVGEELRPALIVAFDYAVAFVARTIINKLTAGDRLMLRRVDDLQASMDALRAQGLQIVRVAVA